MGPEHFFKMVLGAPITMAIRYRGHREVRPATAKPDRYTRRGIALLRGTAKWKITA